MLRRILNRDWLLATALAWVLLLPACGNYEGDATPVIDDGGGQASGPPVLNTAGAKQYQQQCASCHGVDGGGSASGPSLLGCSSCADAFSLADRIVTTMPLGRTESCGLQCGSDTADYILAAFNGAMLTEAVVELDNIQKAAPVAVLRKATLNLVGRLPSPAEQARIDRDGSAALPELLLAVMAEPVFSERLIEIYNDVLLQNKYLGGLNALDLLRSGDGLMSWV